LFSAVICWANPSRGRFWTCGTDKDSRIVLTKGYLYLTQPPFHFYIGCIRKVVTNEANVRLIKVKNIFEVYGNLLRQFKRESSGVKYYTL
jgi:hypothetical protein